MNSYAFEAMGTTVVVRGAPRSRSLAVERLFAQRERTFSPFRADSELSAVNRAAGRLVQVSALFSETLAIALSVARETEGLVDPTLGSALRAAGLPGSFGVPLAAPGSWSSVRLYGRLVGIPAGTCLDLNGVVKSLAVDDALELVPEPGLVSAGGDLATRGPLTVALPGGGEVLLRRGALATSGTTRRRWLHAGRLEHHLIDPRTGRPASSPWCEVSACGATCLAADVAAKAGFLAGVDGPAWLDRRGIPARFLADGGEATCNAAWQAALSEATACT